MLYLRLSIYVAMFLWCDLVAAEQPLTSLNREPARYAAIENLVQESLDAGDMAGAVVVVASKDDVLYSAAFGNRQVEPTGEAMTLDTVFDLASLTKPIATATSIMILVDQGKLEVEETLQNYLPEFCCEGKEKITIEQLLRHTSGLIPDNPLKDYQSGPEAAWKNICLLTLRSEPGEKFAYSDVNFIVLGKLVEKISGLSLHHFSRDNIFLPLGMTETMFNPGRELQARAAATERQGDLWLKGQVHDPRAALLQGVAGHAGLFSTAGDLVAYGQALLRKGKHTDGRMMDDETFDRMIRPQAVSKGTRTLGWDHRSAYSSNRGERLSDSAFGHGGFTGTVLWVDPEKDRVFIFLSNRLHPDGKGSVNSLAGKIADVIGG